MIRIGDKNFEEFLGESEILSCVRTLAKRIDDDYTNKELLILGILNGAFLFVADLTRHMTLDPEISFVKFASYEGTSSSGKVNDLIGLHEDLRGKHVLVVEDIVDSGRTLLHIQELLKDKGTASIEVATLFFKPDAYQQKIPLRYIGAEIPNHFVVGYGMDYMGKGRNLTGLYQLRS
ncbi:MAG: hypoxanthine phosphoribosyltransferase [Reichenbachiella sp.]|uniref:hypoxanthine phosphoribosyltransferase n=1 Tax=Reichenbachiella sp. TaxID=2184521 RepID=UPI003263E709